MSLFIIISGAALMYSYEEKCDLKLFFKKRFTAIYPMFWSCYIIMFLYAFYINKQTPVDIPPLNFLLTLVGMDGYFKYKIPNYYLVGEWFLGFIIIMYLLFPILRACLVKRTEVLTAFVVVLYFVCIRNYQYFDISFERNIITRLPGFLFGMIFVKYIKRVNIIQFVVSMVAALGMLFIEIPIHGMYKITIMGISVFFILVYIAQIVQVEKVKAIFIWLSKYSYAIFWVHHIIIQRTVNRFNYKSLTILDCVCLYAISAIAIGVLSVALSRITRTIMGNIVNSSQNKVY